MIYTMTLTRHIRTICILVVIAVCAFAPGQARAQAMSPELTVAFEKFQKLNKQGKYAEAIPFVFPFQTSSYLRNGIWFIESFNFSPRD